MRVLLKYYKHNKFVKQKRYNSKEEAQRVSKKYLSNIKFSTKIKEQISTHIVKDNVNKSNIGCF